MTTARSLWYGWVMRGLIGTLLLTTLVACTDEAPAPDLEPEDLAPPPEGQGFQLSMEGVAPPLDEVWLCDIYELPTEEVANVHRVEARQTDNNHHLTLSILGITPTDKYAFGRYDCNDLFGDSSFMEDQIMIYGNQGVSEHELTLPDGVAATLPPKLTVLHEIHYVNTSSEEVKVFSKLNAWTIPQEEVESGIWGGSVRDENIVIPPSSQHTEWSRCVFNTDVEVLFLASHMHALGSEFTIRPFDGETAGDVMYTNTDWHFPLITQFEEPMPVKAGEGFEWACTWDNDTANEVNYGLESTDEMCNMVVIHTPFDLSALCEVVETSDGVLYDPDAGNSP